MWLIAGSGRGRVIDLAETELAALAGASREAVLAINADADDAERIAHLLLHGYRRVFSRVELERDTSTLMASHVPALISPAHVGDAEGMHQLPAWC